MRLDHEQDRLLRQLLDLGFPLLVEARDVLELLLDQRLHLPLVLADLVALLLREGVVLLLAERLAVLVQRKGVDPDGSSLHGEAELARLRFHLLEERRPALAVAIVDLLASCLELVRLEDLGDLAFQAVDVMLEVGAELAALAGRELQVPGAVGIVEVVDVAEVGRLRLVGARPCEEALDRRHLAGSRIPGDVDVVSVLDVLDAESEFECVDRPFLSDDLIERLELGGRLESERRGVTCVA